MTDPRTPLLSIRDLFIEFDTPDGTVKAVNGIDLDLYKGEVLGIVGESGSGKSQSWMATLGLLADNARTSGAVTFDGQNLLELPTKALNPIRGKRISMVFQDPMTSLNPYLNIQTQMVEALRIHNRGMSKQDARQRCIEMLDRVAIPAAEKRLKQFPHELSGGMRQRVMIALALLNDPEILIADEPTTALDVTIQAEILDILTDLQRERGMAVVFITHDLGVVAELCSRVCVMYAGRLAEVGPVEDVFTDARHPYTLSLLKATPRAAQTAQVVAGSGGAVDPTGSREELYAIPGAPPNMRMPPPGCPFEPRCACANPDCALSVPALEPVDGAAADAGRLKACFRQGTSAELSEALLTHGR